MYWNRQHEWDLFFNLKSSVLVVDIKMFLSDVYRLWIRVFLYFLLFNESNQLTAGPLEENRLDCKNFCWRSNLQFWYCSSPKDSFMFWQPHCLAFTNVKQFLTLHPDLQSLYFVTSFHCPLIIEWVFSFYIMTNIYLIAFLINFHWQHCCIFLNMNHLWPPRPLWQPFYIEMSSNIISSFFLTLP